MSRFLPFVLAATASFSSMLGAQEVGRVVSSMPIIQQVAVPRQVCTQQQVATQAQKSGAGSAMGAIAGGVVGNAIGKGEGNALATAIGLIGGAILGDRIEGAPPTEMRNVQTCSTQNFYENRTIAYNVVYEFNGKQYTVSMPQDPGPFVKLQVTPVSATSTVPATVATFVQPAVTAQEVIVVERPTYVMTQRNHYARPYHPPVGVNLHWGYPLENSPRHWR